MLKYAYLIPAFPFIAFWMLLLCGRRVPRLLAAWLSISAIGASFVVSLGCFTEVAKGGCINIAIPWLSFTNLSLTFGITVDPLTSVMLLIVSFIGMLIQIYSIGYMHTDKRFSRFFAYMSLFSFSMLGLVLADNFVLLFVFWELVGLCSYLLISFWFEKTTAADAGKKAFITTRIGDTGLLIGILLLFYATGTLRFSQLEEVLVTPWVNSGVLSAAAILIFCGAVGKSAQFPLHVWLPDAMEGPTPVSALIHAATMVAAGVYLVARTFVLFHACPNALQVVAYTGTITAFMAATIALVVTDIKRVLAYSTISQLGYMMMALGVGGYTAGTFHLMTHAFFKALLFLGAGSVIHGTGTQDIRDLGGLLPKMKKTAATFIIASLAIAGIPPFSGFWSKDEILLEAFRSGHTGIFVIGIVTALLTAFYMFRLCFLTFFGKPRNPRIDAHESPYIMTVPLMILAVFAVIAGFPGSPFMDNWFGKFVHFGSEQLHSGGGAAHPDTLVMALSIGVALLGIILAWVTYVKRWFGTEPIKAKFGNIYKLLANKYWIDEIYDNLIIQPFLRLTRICFRFDEIIIDGAVNGAAYVVVFLSEVKRLFDEYVVDGAVNGIGWIFAQGSTVLRRVQTGFVQNYLLVAFVGIIALILVLIRRVLPI
jgi:NADH-quinone oxidoreductase subunit L